MAAEFRPTSPDELNAVRALLFKSFHAPEDTPAFDRSMLSWKYYEPGAPWGDSRSYVLSDNGVLLAHAAIWPLRLRIENDEQRSFGFADWAASEEHRGVGLLLLKKLMTLAPVIIVIGGAEITRQILPRVGFKRWADLPVYARVMRPLRQSVMRPSRDSREPLRLVRNTSWSLAALAPTGDWTAERSLPDEATLSLLHQQTGMVYGREFVEFILRCPKVRFYSIILKKAGLPRGLAIVSVVDGQARVADFRIDSQEQADWNAALAATTKLLKKEKDVCEAISLAATPALEVALSTNGFRIRERRPLVVFDAEGKMNQKPVPQIGMLADDYSYLHVSDYPFLT